jgi:hypothetical protein
MKIGILTFHEGINHGGFFQAFFLQSYLTSLGHDVAIINYKNSSHWLNEYKSFLITKSIFKLKNNVLKIWNFRKDQKQLKLIPKTLTTDSKIIPLITSELDVIVVGSDVVWDFEFSFTGFDKIYFGQGLNPKYKVISYAASMGRSKSDLPNHLSKHLATFSAISVRDENTSQFVRSATGRDVVKVVDPTLLIPLTDLPMPMKHWSAERIKARYLLVYAFLLPEDWREAVREFAEAKGLEIFVVGYPHPELGKDFTHIGPFEWLDFFKNSEYVITSTFHGTIFSILSNKKFLVIPNNAIENKVVSLLSDLDLTDRYMNGGCSFSLIEYEICWVEVEKNLERLRSVAHKYLNGALQ